MEFPPSWTVQDADSYLSAVPTGSGDYYVEVFAQLRSTGRILDGFRLAVDGSKPLEICIDLQKVIPGNFYSGWQYTQQLWPRDIVFRQNMMTSTWSSITDTISSNDGEVLDGTGAGVSSSGFMRSLQQLPDDGPTNASTRWAVVIGSDGYLKLQWQGLPLVASVLNSRSVFKRYVRNLIFI